MLRFLLLTSVLTLAACGGSAAPADAPSGEVSAAEPVKAGVRRDINVAELKTELEKDDAPVVVDVRTPAEFASGHVPGALNIPLDELMERTSDLPEGDETFIICQSGGRSSRAADMLAASGRNAVNIKGGTLAWLAENPSSE